MTEVVFLIHFQLLTCNICFGFKLIQSCTTTTNRQWFSVTDAWVLYLSHMNCASVFPWRFTALESGGEIACQQVWTQSQHRPLCDEFTLYIWAAESIARDVSVSQFACNRLPASGSAFYPVFQSEPDWLMGGWIAEEMNWTVCGRVECNVCEKATRLTILLK